MPADSDDSSRATVNAKPDGYGTVTPWVVTADSRGMLDFVARAFGATEIARVENEDGSIGHAETRIGDSVVMMFDSRPGWPPTPALIRLYVDDADATYAEALRAGAAPVTEVTGLFFGDRVGRVRDPFGNIWWLQTHVEDVDPGEMWERAQDPEAAASMRHVQESLDRAMRAT